MSNRYLVDWSKKEDESSSRFRSSVPPCVGTHGDRNWIWWREWRQASPYFFPTHQMRQPLPGIGSPLGFLPWGLSRRFVFHPPRRVSARAPRLSPLCHPSTAVLNSSPRAPPLCTFRMLLLSLQTFVLFERKCPAKWTSHDIPPWFQFEANVFHS